MPRLPDLNDLGTRPAPQSRSRIVSTPGVGAVGDAVSGLGNQFSRIGQQQFEKQDRLAYASAKALVANEDIAARKALEDDPDFGTAEARYTERMKAAQANALKAIASRADRAMFEIDSNGDIDRGLGQVSGMVHAKRVDKGRADLATSIEALSKSAIDAPDDATRQNIFSTVSELLTGAKDNGYISAVEVGNMSRSFAATDAGNRIERSLASDDVDGANRILEASKGAMPAKNYTDYFAMIQSKKLVREAYGDASTVMGSGWTPETGSPANYADPLRGRGLGVSDAFGKDRGNGKTHNGVDFVAPAGTPIFAIGPGRVTKVERDEKSGNFVMIDHGDGKTSSYSHMSAPSGLKDGDTVTPDTQLGKVGATGHATGAHLHLVVRENGAVVDPTKVIGSAQQEPKRHDLNQLLAQADAVAEQQGWSFERRERAKDEIRKRVSTDELLKNREEDKADRDAQEIILGKREGFTDTAMIPRQIWGSMSTSARMSAMNLAKENSKPKDPPANGLEIMTAHAIMYSNPEAFKNMDLTPFVGKVTRGELDSLISEQAKLRNPANSQDVSLRGAISSSITFHTKTDAALDRALDPKLNPAAYANVAQDMEGYLRSVTGGKRQATDAELDAAFNRATMNVIVKGGSWFGLADKESPRYALKAGDTYSVDVPEDVRQRIIQTYGKANPGMRPNDTLITQIYVQHKGKAGFWP